MARVVINTMFTYHFVYPDLGAKTFFEKEGDKEQGVDFEI